MRLTLNDNRTYVELKSMILRHTEQGRMDDNRTYVELK